LPKHADQSVRTGVLTEGIQVTLLIHLKSVPDLQRSLVASRTISKAERVKLPVSKEAQNEYNRQLSRLLWHTKE